MKNIAIPCISRYSFCASSYQIKALVIINLKVEIAWFMHDPLSLHEINSVFSFGLLCINYVHVVLRTYDTIRDANFLCAPVLKS